MLKKSPFLQLSPEEYLVCYEEQVRELADESSSWNLRPEDVNILIEKKDLIDRYLRKELKSSVPEELKFRSDADSGSYEWIFKVRQDIAKILGEPQLAPKPSKIDSLDHLDYIRTMLAHTSGFAPDGHLIPIAMLECYFRSREQSFTGFPIPAEWNYHLSSCHYCRNKLFSLLNLNSLIATQTTAVFYDESDYFEKSEESDGNTLFKIYLNGSFRFRFSENKIIFTVPHYPKLILFYPLFLTLLPLFRDFGVKIKL